MRVIHLARKPLIGSVAANTLEHGAGGLNIDAGRIGTGADKGVWPVTNRKGRISLNAADDGSLNTPSTTNTSKGRWPSNVLIQHLDGCRCEGTKKVKGVNQPGRGGQGDIDSGIGFSGAKGQQRKAPFYTDAEGKEKVPAWKCEPGCPVADLDGQGCHSTTGHRSEQSRAATVGNTLFGTDNHLSQEYPGESGGASRFYKQVGGEPCE